jgi:hypothetical protein
VREREIEALGDHLARLLAQGDELLREWKAYGDGLRQSIDRQLAGLDAELAQGVAKAARQVAPRAAQELSGEVEGLRAELQALRAAMREAAGEVGGRRARPWRRHLPTLALVLALLANGVVAVTLLRPPPPVPLRIDTDR